MLVHWVETIMLPVASENKLKYILIYSGFYLAEAELKKGETRFRPA